MEILHKLLILLLFFTVLLSCAVRLPDPTRNFTSQEIARRMIDSTVFLRIVRKTSAGSYQISYGSGFVVRSGYVATSYHVIEGMELKPSSVKLVGSGKDLPIELVVAEDRDYDLAILRCSRIKAPPLTLGNSKNIEIGEVVYVAGNPRGFKGTFSAGVISAIRDNAFVSSDDVIQISAPVSPGSSGDLL